MLFMKARAHHINPGPHEKRGMRSSARVGLGEDHIYAFLMHKYRGKKWAWAKTIEKLHGPATAARLYGGISKRCHQSGARGTFAKECLKM